jgi:hypothetical protein
MKPQAAANHARSGGCVEPTAARKVERSGRRPAAQRGGMGEEPKAIRETGNRGF